MHNQRIQIILRIITLVIIVCGFSFLTGCAHGPIRTGWIAAKNRKVMIHVQPDMTIEEVTKVMGKPDKTELFRGKNNEPILVYLYIIEGKDLIRRRWNDSNYSPFVFINERLQGWGWSDLETVAKKNGFLIKEQ